MTFDELSATRRVAREPTNRAEIDALRELARRGLADAALDALSVDGRFAQAHGAARALATMVIRACGYRARQPGAHRSTFLALAAADPDVFATDAAHFDACRALRDRLCYEAAGVVPEAVLEELLEKVPAFARAVDAWIAAKRPELA
jgi:hypothetical protein